MHEIQSSRPYIKANSQLALYRTLSISSRGSALLVAG